MTSIHSCIPNIIPVSLHTYVLIFYGNESNVPYSKLGGISSLLVYITSCNWGAAVCLHKQMSNDFRLLTLFLCSLVYLVNHIHEGGNFKTDLLLIAATAKC